MVQLGLLVTLDCFQQHPSGIAVDKVDATVVVTEDGRWGVESPNGGAHGRHGATEGYAIKAECLLYILEGDLRSLLTDDRERRDSVIRHLANELVAALGSPPTRRGNNRAGDVRRVVLILVKNFLTVQVKATRAHDAPASSGDVVLESMYR